MGKSTPVQPTPPDPTALANAQAGANKDTAITQAELNAVNSVSPFGTVSYSQQDNPNAPGIPQFTSTTAFSPDQQALYDAQTGIEKQAYNTGSQALGNVQSTLSSPFTLSGMPSLISNVNSGQLQNGYNSVNPLFGIAPAGNIQTSVGDAGKVQGSINPYGQIQNQITPSGQIQNQISTNGLPSVPLTANDFAAQGNATTDALMQRYNQDWNNQQESTYAGLNAQGAQLGSKQYDIANQQLARNRNDAMAQALLAGNQEQNTLFNQSLASNQNQFGQNAAQANFTNAAQGQQFGQNAAQAAFTNAAQAQGYGQNANSAAFANQAQQQLYEQLLGSGNFTNAAQAQQFGQNAAQQQAYNQAASQATGNDAAQAAFTNAAQQQGFGQAQANASLQNQARQQSIAEQQLMRSQPINEIAALLGLGSGIQTPTAAPNFGINIGQTDVLGAQGLSQQVAQNNYNQQMAANNAITGAFGNLIGTAGSALIMKSDRRKKTAIRLCGRTMAGTPLFVFAYKDRPGVKMVGVMAQDMMRINPLAVHEKSGVYHVDYGSVV